LLLIIIIVKFAFFVFDFYTAGYLLSDFE